MAGNMISDTEDLRSLQRLAEAKKSTPRAASSLGDEMLGFFRQSVQKRQTKLLAIAQSWQALVPELFSEHCALEGLTRGTLTVLVDSAAFLYELKQLLLAGLEKQLLIACRSTGLRKISLKFGRWYDGDSSDQHIRFEDGRNRKSAARS